MLALSLWQPWASLLVHGHKRVETRSWSLARGGRALPCVLAVHAAKLWTDDQQDLCGEQPFHEALLACGFADKRRVTVEAIPRGAVVGVVRVTEVHETGDFSPWVEGLSDRELAFGDYHPGRFGWACDRFFELPEPVPCKGRQSLFRWEPPAGLELPGWATEG